MLHAPQSRTKKSRDFLSSLPLRRNEISSPINWSESVANLTKISIPFNFKSDYLNFSRSKRVWKYLCSDRKLSKLILCNIFILFFFFFCIHEFLPYRLFERFRLLIAVRNLFDYLNFFFSRAAWKYLHSDKKNKSELIFNSVFPFYFVKEFVFETNYFQLQFECNRCFLIRISRFPSKDKNDFAKTK